MERSSSRSAKSAYRDDDFEQCSALAERLGTRLAAVGPRRSVLAATGLTQPPSGAVTRVGPRLEGLCQRAQHPRSAGRTFPRPAPRAGRTGCVDDCGCLSQRLTRAAPALRPRRPEELAGAHSRPAGAAAAAEQQWLRRGVPEQPA
jgi:hypothetical protein